MYKAIYLVRRNPALTAEEFPQRWKRHAVLAGTVKQILGYYTSVVQCAQAGLQVPADAGTGYDGVNLLGLKDRAYGYAPFDLPEHREIMLPDELKTFSRPIRECTLVTKEHVVRNGAFTPLLVLNFLKRAPEVTQEKLLSRWCEVLRALTFDGKQAHLVRRSVVNQVVETPPPDYGFDIVTETWFADEGGLRAYFAAAEVQERLKMERTHCCEDPATVVFTARVTHAYPRIAE